MEDQRRVTGDEVYGDKVGGDKVLGDKITVTGDGSQVIIGDKIYTRSQAEELRDYLAQAVAALEARMYQLVARPAAPSAHPYKFLYAFEVEDADIFFGRDTASKAFYQTILKDRLTVLHAKSGAGKTSLLNAGLSPGLIREGRLPVYARAYEDPILSIKRAISPPSLGPWPELLFKLTLHEFLGLACAHLSRQTQELVIILDQFEEFFIFWPEREHRQPFSDTLADCYDDKALPVRFVIALRGEYFTDLADFQVRLPNVFHNHYRLDAMSRTEARAAITGPVIRLSRQVTYEPVLLDILLNDLARGGMELPHLQIICTRLYEALPPEQTTITLAVYDNMERAEGVLGSYLTEVLAKFPGMQGIIAKEVLKELVSSGATKRVLSRESLGARVQDKAGLAKIEKAELDEVLARLVDARLLRWGQETGVIQYEMAHDYLAEQIEGWLDQEDLEVKQAEELLEREIANWHASGTLMSADRLRVIADQFARLTLSSEAQEFLLRSALARAHDVTHWWAQYPCSAEATELVTSFLLGDDRQRAHRLANTLWPEGLPLNEALDPLVEQITKQLDSEDARQRQRAREIQVFIGPVVRQTLRGHFQSLQIAFRLLVSNRWSAILTLALGGALGGLMGGVIQCFLGLAMGFVNPSPGSLSLLEFIVINGPAIAIFAALIGTGLCFGTVLARGRSLLFEAVGGACGGAMGGLFVTFYFILLGIQTPGPSLLLTFFDLTLSSAVLAVAIVTGIRIAGKWSVREDKSWKRTVKQISGAVLASGIAGIVRDILFGVFPGGTLVAIFLSACFATGLSLAELSLTRK